MKLAIVGSVRFHHPDAPSLALVLIRHKFRIFEPELLISGGADGIDKLAEQVADEFGVEKDIRLPKNNRWAPDGYQDRNREIADRCTHLLAVRDYLSKNNRWVYSSPYGTYGSGWTADEAERFGKVVERVVL